MSVNGTGRLEKSLWYHNWPYAFECVFEVFQENRRTEGEAGGFEAKADVWMTNETLRRRNWERARHYWCRRTGLDLTRFPLSVDAVALLYEKIRKRNDEERATFKRETEAALGVRPAALFDDPGS